MKFRGVVVCLLLVGLAILESAAQSRETYRGLLNRQVASDTLPGPAHLRDYLSDGKLQLSLHDAIVLTLENNSAVRVEETQVETDKFSLLNTLHPFDPQLQTLFNATRYSYNGTNQPQGVGVSGNSTLIQLTQEGQINYNQTFQTGTQLQVQLTGVKNSTNSTFYFFNPYTSSTLNLQFTQPLLRNRGLFVNRAPIVIARRVLAQSRASFEAEVNDAILQAVRQYWAVVQDRGNLEVEEKSLEAADVSYQRDK